MSAADSEPVPVKQALSSSSGKDVTASSTTTQLSNTATNSAPPNAPSPVQAALDFWRNFNLNDRRAELDTQGLAIADRQEASSTSRKQLASDTKNFRKSMTDNKQVSAKEVGPLLRAYQLEIDSLTNRAKAAETSFISLYKALYDAPDPVEVLSQAMRDAHLVLQLREQISTMKEERGQLFERSANNSVLEKRIMELESELRTSSKRAKEEAHALLEQEQSQWMAAQQKTIEAYEMREQELLHQVRQSNESIRRMQAQSDDMQQQLNDSRSELEHMKSTRASVNDMAVEDLERTRAEANSLRRRCKQLENRLAGRSEDDDANDMSEDVINSIGPSALSAEIAARDVQISQLRDQVSTLEEVLGGKDQEKRNEFAKLSNAITEKDTELTQLRGRLDQLPSVEEYETMKRQFETLQSFQMLDAMENEVSNSASNKDGKDNSKDSGGATDKLEKRLLNKVKSLESRLTKLRVEVSERDAKINELKGVVRRFEDQVVDQKTLISKLEDGINTITGEKGGMHALKRRAMAASKGESDGKTESGAGGPDANEMDDEEDQSAWDWGDKHQAEGLENIISEEPSMLDIIAGQRDRFRARTLELEEDNRKLMEKIEKLSGDIDSLKNDNVKLYEKLRFVQSYRQTNGSMVGTGGVSNISAGTTTSGTSNSVEIAVGTMDDEEDGSVLGKYKSMYEDMVNPYTIFNRRERHKRLSEMSAPERLTLRASQKALSTKTSRLVVFFYIIALHVLVFLVIGFSSTMCESESVTTKARH